MSATSLVTNAGARSRIALFVAGLTMVLVVLAFSELVGYIAMPALAGLLVIVGFRTLKPEQVRMVWRTGPIQATVMTLTFVLTLVIPLQYAVLVDIGMSVLLYVIRQSNRITIKSCGLPRPARSKRVSRPPRWASTRSWCSGPTGACSSPPPGRSRGAARPSVSEESRRSVVILTLRGKEDLGSTFINLTTRYAKALADHDCLLWISGVSERTFSQLENTGAIDVIGPARVHVRTSVVAESTRGAVAEAETWIGSRGAPR